LVWAALCGAGCLNQTTPLFGKIPDAGELDGVPDAGSIEDGGIFDGGTDAGPVIDAGEADSGFDAGSDAGDGGPQDSGSFLPDAAVACAPAAGNPLLNRTVYDSPYFYQLVATGDLNGDGLLDVVALRAPQSVNGFDVLYGQADGSLGGFKSYFLHGAMSFDVPVAVSDLNADGFADVVTCIGSQLSVFLGSADAGLSKPASYSVNDSSVWGLGIGDFNGDGFPDLVWSSSTGGGILYNQGDGTFDASGSTLDIPGAVSNGVVVGDLNGDGRPDVAVNGSSVFLVLSQADGTYQTDTLSNVAAGGGEIAIFTADGHASLAIMGAFDTEGAGSAQLLAGDGSGDFSDGGQVFLGDLSFYLTTGDFNGDCIPDLVGSGYQSCGQQTGTLMVAFGLPDGGFDTAVGLDAGMATPAGVALLGPVSAPQALVVVDACGGGIAVLGDASKH
jgi:hypothetical protein